MSRSITVDMTPSALESLSRYLEGVGVPISLDEENHTLELGNKESGFIELACDSDLVAEWEKDAHWAEDAERQAERMWRE